MKGIITIIVLTFYIGKINAQGLIFDSTEYSKREKIEETRAELPTSSSLKKYTPLIYPQVGATCVAHSFANAMTMLYAKKLFWTDKDKITGLSFSPYYIYYRNKEFGDLNCEVGLSIEAVAGDALRNGIAPIAFVEYPNYYPFTNKALCIEKNGQYYPPSMAEDLNYAQKFKLDQVYRVASLMGLKTALSAGMPVILCLYTPNSFVNLKGDVWIPQLTDRIDKKKGHSLLAIGYDDNKYGGAIELMNSWGDTWGNKGFTWVRYRDYVMWFVAGYALYVDNSSTYKSTNNPQFIPEAKIEKKVMKLNSYDGKSKIKFNNSEFIKSFKAAIDFQ